MTNREYALDFIRKHFPDYPAVWIDAIRKYVVCIVDPSNNQRQAMGVCWFDDNDGWATFHTLGPDEAIEYESRFNLDALPADI